MLVVAWVSGFCGQRGGRWAIFGVFIRLIDSEAEEITMAKGRDTQKTAKKASTKTLKEKRNEKKAKKAQQDAG